MRRFYCSNQLLPIVISTVSGTASETAPSISRRTMAAAFSAQSRCASAISSSCTCRIRRASRLRLNPAQCYHSHYYICRGALMGCLHSFAERRARLLTSATSGLSLRPNSVVHKRRFGVSERFHISSDARYFAIYFYIFAASM